MVGGVTPFCGKVAKIQPKTGENVDFIGCYTFSGVDREMSSKKTKVLTVRIASEAVIALELEAERSGKSVKELIEILGMDISEGRLSCNEDSFVPPDEYLDKISPDEYSELSFDVIKEAYERCGYPDSAVRSSNEMIASMIRDGGRYSTRKQSEGGC